MRYLLILISFCLALPAVAEDAQPARPKKMHIMHNTIFFVIGFIL